MTMGEGESAILPEFPEARFGRLQSLVFTRFSNLKICFV
ncbi:hypothetical protein PCA20602_03894 [Pandoraea capi]|uniref:Transposase n=1 Tax=Pandoraea capi TaxID=2508286 RepID=A0ABY6W7E6_9BURK|nr:hypothetical protein PCA20602_03894 [Pandoraea capi]